MQKYREISEELEISEGASYDALRMKAGLTIKVLYMMTARVV
ncbi:hypothetical protein [Ilyobacter sp.]